VSALAQSIAAIQHSPVVKRQEENHKYLLRKFFRFLQGDHKDPSRSFENVFHAYLSPEFTESEAVTFFKPIHCPKTAQQSHQTCLPTRLSQIAFWMPVKFTNNFITRMIRIPKLRTELLTFMQDHLLDIAREEMRTKTLSIIRRFKGYLEDHSYDLYSTAMANSLSSKKLKFWGVNEVEQLIRRMTARIGAPEHSERLPSGPT